MSLSNAARRIPMAYKDFPKKKKPIDLVKKWNIFRGDKVEVIAGSCKGQQGVVEQCIKDANRLVIGGVNMSQRRIAATPLAPGKTYLAPSPIHYSNVSLLCPETSKPTRIAVRKNAEGLRVRVSKRSGAIIPKPVVEALKPRPTETGPMDTPPDAALKRTVSDLGWK